MTYTPFAIANKDKVRPLAVAMEARHPLLPDVPTFKELGVDSVDGATAASACRRRRRPTRRSACPTCCLAQCRPADEGAGGKGRLRARQRRPRRHGQLHAHPHEDLHRGRQADGAGRREMRIVDVREKTAPIASPIRNAYIDFSKMTASVVAVVTDVVRDGKPVVGYGFNSNGRYAQGVLLRERFIPRLLEADPDIAPRRRPATTSIRTGLGRDDDQREAGRPRRALGRGRHDRHGGLGRGRQDRGQAALPPARRALPRRQGEPARLRLRRRRLLLPGQGRHALQDEMRGYLDLGYTRRQDEDRRRVARRRPAPHRGGARGGRRRPEPRGRCQRPLRSRDRDRLRRRRSRPTTCSGTRKPAIRSTTSCRRRSRHYYRTRWRPARTSSRCRTRAT